MIDEPHPPEVSVAVALLRLSAVEQWRYVLRRVYPRSRDPIRTGVVRTLLLTGYLAFVGAFVALLGQMIPAPWTLAVAGAVCSLLWPRRLWSVKRASIALWRRSDTFEVDLGPAGIAIRSAFQVLTVRWGGIDDLISTPREVVIRLRSGAVLSIPARAFRDDAHLGRFVTTVRSRMTAAAEAQSVA